LILNYYFLALNMNYIEPEFKNSYQKGKKKGIANSNTFNILTIVNHYFL
tara:strand:+ start:323 stop:469 length:147 start_codon:yes stop_codon:yes gene_type:complete